MRSEPFDRSPSRAWRRNHASSARAAALGIFACLAASLAACGGSAGIAEVVEIDAAAWDSVAPHLRLTVTPSPHQGMDRYSATFFSARVVMPDDNSVEVARYRSYRKEDNSTMRGWLSGAGEQRVALKRVSLDEAALVRAKQLGEVVVHVDELRGDEVVVADAHVARLGVAQADAMQPVLPAAVHPTRDAGDGQSNLPPMIGPPAMGLGWSW